jgi:hypothetical protein
MHEPLRIVPHPRTLRKAREQVKHMVIDGTSSRRIRNYLHRWVAWWVNASDTWQYQELLQWFMDVCWQARVTDYARGIYQLHFNKLHNRSLAVGVAA